MCKQQTTKTHFIKRIGQIKRAINKELKECSMKLNRQSIEKVSLIRRLGNLKKTRSVQKRNIFCEIIQIIKIIEHLKKQRYQLFSMKQLAARVNTSH